MEKILIVGGAGFIGSNLCQKLCEEENEVAILDNFIQYSDPLEVNYSTSLTYRKKLLEGAKIYRMDASIAYDMIKCLEDFNPDRIIHLAALTRADINDDNITGAMEKSTLPIINIIEYYRNSPKALKRFMYISSSYVYGDFEYSPCDEDHIKKPKSTYGGVKFSCEILTGAWCRRFNIPFTIIRPIAAYGPSDLNGKLSMQNIKRVIDNKELYIMGTLEELSDYTYIDDLSEGLILALFSEKAVGEVFNLSSGRGLKVSELVDCFNKLGYDVKPVMSEVLKSRPKRGYLDINKAKNILGYTPTTDIKVGLSKCIEYINNHKINIGE